MDSKSQCLRIRIRQNASVKEKTLIRVVAETLKKLVQLYQIKNAEEILSSLEIQTLRYKLKECLNKLIFLEPLEFGQKAEDTIWKSIFYEPIRIFKREIKNKSNIMNSKSLLVAFQRHIIGAIGYYQKLILRLQTQFGLLKEMCPDFKGFLLNEDEIEKEISPELKSWAFSCIQHSLLYIGDLYRYQHEIKCANSRLLANRYYNMVLSLNPSFGHAYNQLATLDTLSYYGLNAAYFYLKGQLCSNPFAQTKENLLILFERNTKRLISVLDRETSIRKSGSNISKNGIKVMRVKSWIIKYINVWHSFTTPGDMNHYDIKQLAAMCDDVLNILSIVLGFDRKLVSNPSNADNGVRPSSLNVKIVTQILFIASSCLEIMRPKNDQNLDPEQLKQAALKFDLAHSFSLNLYGHVFNQCLVRIRDELRASNIDISFLLRRHDNNEKTGLLESESCDEVCSAITEAISSDQTATVKPRKKRIGLSKRLVRVRHDTDDTNKTEDLSEDDQNISESDVLWDDDISDSSVSDQDENMGFGFSDVDDETDFESNEEIHSQDEDNQIIRAIVGHNTVFGRCQTSDAKDKKLSKNKDSSNKVIFSDSIIMDDSKQLSKPKHRFPQNLNPVNENPIMKPSYETLMKIVHNVDLLQSLSVLLMMGFGWNSDDMSNSFSRVWRFAPYLWKHMSVMLNFCENILDNLNQSEIIEAQCDHYVSHNVRSMVNCILPEDRELSMSSNDIDNNHQIIRCDNAFHHIVTRILRFIKYGQLLMTLQHEGPITATQTNSNCVWSFSQPRIEPRTNLVMKSWTQIFANNDSQNQNILSSTVDKEKLMREMAKLRLKNELLRNSQSDEDDNNPLTKSRSPSSDNFRAVYLIPDVDYICGRLDSVKSLVRTQKYICVIPQAVIQKLDRLKTHDHSARQAIKYLEVEMESNNQHIKIESLIPLKTAAKPCEFIQDWGSIETTAMRFVDESVVKSSPGHDIVVTILTMSVSRLSTEFMDHYSKKRINFQSNIDI